MNHSSRTMFDTISAGLLSDGAFIRHVPSPYTPSQVRQYLRYISWPGIAVEVEDDNSPIEFDPSLENLTELMVHHCVTFPMENTDLHYTREHRMPVKPHELFERMVLKGKGSYCFGQNGLFLGMLRGLGYRAYGVAGRVLDVASNDYPADPASPVEGRVYTTLAHMTILVQPYSAHSLLNVTFVVDMGFGGLGPMRPILLADGSDGDEQKLPSTKVETMLNYEPRSCKGGWVWGTFPPARHRIVKGAHYSSSLETSPGSGFAPPREWHMQVTLSPLGCEEEKWTTLYTFTEAEFFQRDIDAANVVASTFDDMPFPHFVMCLKRFEVSLDELRRTSVYDTSDDDDSEQILRSAEELSEKHGLRWMGQWTLDGEKAFKRIGGKCIEEVRFRNESERIIFLKERIGVGITEDDKQWIIGRKAALQAS